MQNIYKILENDILRINDTIINHLESQEELVEVVSKYLVNSTSKRLRPILTIICSKLFDYSGDAHINLASAVELIHTATLLHDDVVDDSLLRRFKPTANTIWGNKVSILVGDFLFSQSFKLMVSSNSMAALASLAQASAIIAEGEVMQLTALNKQDITTEKEYHQIIMAKTAELFGAACEVGAIISNKTDERLLLKRFGITIGILFQVADDLLDYFGDPNDTGKNIGDDFSEGKITLPFIWAFNKATPQERVFLQNAIFATNKNDHSSLQDVIKIMKIYDIRNEIANHIKILLSEGMAILTKIDGNKTYKDLLEYLLQYSISRALG